MASINYLGILTCRHVINVPGTRLKAHCPRCNGMKFLADIHIYEWHAVCQVCIYSRFYGLSRPIAERAANRHVLLTGHRTACVYEVNPVSLKYQLKLVEKRAFEPYDSVL